MFYLIACSKGVFYTQLHSSLDSRRTGDCCSDHGHF